MTQDRRITDKLPGHPLQWDDNASPSAAPAAGQAGLAKLLEDLTRPYGVFDVALHACHRDNVQDFLALLKQAKDVREALAAPVAADTEQAKTGGPMEDSNARFAIDAAIMFGREGVNKPPREDHWLYEYWSIGQQLAKLGETSGWDNITPLATPADAGAGLTDGMIVDALHSCGIDTRPSKYGFDALQVDSTSVPSLRAVFDKLLARLSTPGAPAPEGTVTLCQYSSFGPWIECDPSDEKAVKFAPVRQSPAPVTAEPAAFAAWMRTTTDDKDNPYSAFLGGVAWARTAPAPAYRDAIRDQALNINEQFAVTLTETGAATRNSHYEWMREKHLDAAPKLSVAGDVLVEPLWVLMKIFGSAIHMGMPESPFKDNAIRALKTQPAASPTTTDEQKGGAA